VAVHAGDMDLDFCDLSVEVTRHEALAQEFNTVHLSLDAASAVVSAPVLPDRATEVFRSPQGLVSGPGTRSDGLPRLCVFAGLKGVPELIQWINSALNGRSPGR
jgi:hypothetical protein